MSDTSLSTNQRTQPSQPVLTHPEIMRVMTGVVLCILLGALDQTVVIPALPSIAHDLGAYSQLSWVVAAYLITSTISTPIYSKLSDIYGRRRLLVVCIALFVATSTFCAGARSLQQLIWFRALQGLAGGGLVALTQAAIADVMSPRERARYQAYISATWAIASISGPIVGGLIAQNLSWRWIFWINLPIGVAAMWACHNGLRRLALPTHAIRPKFDVVGMALLSGALLLLLLALGWGGVVYSWRSFPILGLVGSGLILLALLTLQESRARDPLLPPRVFANTNYVANVAVSTLMAALTFMCLYTIPLQFQLARGATAAQSGLYLAPFMLASACGNALASLYGRRTGGLRGAMRVAGFFCCAGLASLAALPPDTPAWLIVVAMIIAGAGVGGCNISTMMNSQNALETKDMGAGTGALVVLRSVGGASGSSLAGAIIAVSAVSLYGATSLIDKPNSTGSGFATVYIVATIFAGLCFAIALWMPNIQLRNSNSVLPLPE